MYLSLVLTLVFMGIAQAELFVVQPLQGSTCRANEPCLITWVDNGVRPLLSAVGVSTVGLYTGKQQLVQTIPPVDVSTQHSVTFTPDPLAGANSDNYYIAITSTTLKGNNSVPYSGWSSFFTLTGMTGSFDTPLASATSAIPIPSTLLTSDGVGTSTGTIGTVSTAPTTQSTESSTSASSQSTLSSSTQSRFITSTRSSSSSSASSTPSPSSSSSSASQASSTSSSTAASVSQTSIPIASPLLPTTAPASVSSPVAPVPTSASSAPGSVGTAAAAVTSGANKNGSSAMALTLIASVIYYALI